MVAERPPLGWLPDLPRIDDRKTIPYDAGPGRPVPGATYELAGAQERELNIFGDPCDPAVWATLHWHLDGHWSRLEHPPHASVRPTIVSQDLR